MWRAWVQHCAPLKAFVKWQVIESNAHICNIDTLLGTGSAVDNRLFANTLASYQPQGFFCQKREEAS